MATKTKTKAHSSPRIPEPSVGDKKVLNFRLEPEVIYQLKLLALQERKPVQALLCEGVNEVFAKRGMERIAK